MTIAEFYAFTDTRPDEEKWELIEGEPVLNAAPSPLHQLIVKNLIIALGNRERDMRASWEVLPGLGVRVSETNRPEPDVLVLPRAGPSFDLLSRDRGDVIVAFEILSPSTKSRDLRWKRTAYTSLPTLMDYVVIAQDAVDIVAFARTSGFAEQRFRRLDDRVDLPALGLAIPLAEIYRDTGLT